MTQHSIPNTNRPTFHMERLRMVLSHGAALLAVVRARATTRTALADLSEEILRDIALTPNDTDARLGDIHDRRAERRGNW